MRATWPQIQKYGISDSLASLYSSLSLESEQTIVLETTFGMFTLFY